MSGYEHPNVLSVDQVEDILEAYAEARLTPRRPVLARMRATVIAEAQRAAASRLEDDLAAAAAATGPLRSRVGWRRSLPRVTLASLARPAFALGFAGLLAITTGTAITSAAPGSPLYMARIGLEDMFLPVQIDARFASHEQHLDERLAEAEAAADSGDAAALEAALTAYQDEIDQTLADIGDDYARLDRFEAVLELHVAKLTALSLRLPTDVARTNLQEHAIQASQSAATKAATAVAKVKEKKTLADPATRPAGNDAPSVTTGPTRQTVAPVVPEEPVAPDRGGAP